MIPAWLRRCGPAEPGLKGTAAAARPRHHPRSGGGSTGPHCGLWMLSRECSRLLLGSSGPLFSVFSFLPFSSPLSSLLLLPSFLPSFFWSRLPSPQCRPWTGGGGGHSLTLQFTRNATRYRVRLLHFVYNLGDTDIFPNASSKEVKAEDSMTDILADIDKKYRCVSATQVHMQNVTITLSDTTIEAYLSNGNFSKGETRCKQDLPSPTSVPPAPPKPPTPPSPTPPSPTASTYNVSGNNGTCLLARMGLQLNVTYSRKDNTTMTRVVNINPNVATAMGSCSANLVSLEIRSEDGVILGLNFRMNSSANRFFLETVKLNMTVPDAQGATVQAANNSLRALQATVGNSYKCTTEERLRVTPSFFLNLFSVQVQAFKVEGNKFGSAEVCLLDGNNMLIPIAVGGALAGLVLVVLLAYLIGRKRSHAGYQTI